MRAIKLRVARDMDLPARTGEQRVERSTLPVATRDTEAILAVLAMLVDLHPVVAYHRPDSLLEEVPHPLRSHAPCYPFHNSPAVRLAAVLVLHILTDGMGGGFDLLP